MTAVALTIAGSDPSGGAGIQADLRTFAALGVVGLSVITALTVQNSQGVRSLHPVAPDVLAAQLEAILEDTRPDAVKIGMLGGAAQVRVVADALRRFRPPNVILDPVLASTGGVPLLDDEGRQALLTDLLPLCDLLTPNIPELELLTGKASTWVSDRDEAVEQLEGRGAKAVLVKGGHLDHRPIDRLYIREVGSFAIGGPRIETPHTHGTGCLLSSAIAALLAQGKSLPEAPSGAKRIVARALQTPTVIGRGRGYPDAFTGTDVTTPANYTHAFRISQLAGLYVVTDERLQGDRTAEQIVSAASGEANIFQLRDKTLPTNDLITVAKNLRSMASGEVGFDILINFLFIVNDRVDVALASDADGVHLGPDDMRPEDARRLLGPEKLVGVSTGTLEEARAAAPYASYFGVGAIFGSKTKLDAGAPVGLERIREIKAAFPHIPLVAIGGINRDNIKSVAEAGADAAAVVSAVVAAPDMAEATRELVALFAAGQAARA